MPGEFFRGRAAGGAVLGEFFVPTGAVPRTCGRCGALQVGGGGGFALHEAFWRRVAGVSNPRVVQFPPIGGAAAAVCGDVAAKSSTILVKNAEDGLVVVKWSAFWVHQCLLWRVVRTRTCEYAC